MDTDGGAAELLEEGGFVCRLSSACLAYDDPRRGPAGLAPARAMPAPRPPSGVAHATDAALPPGMLRQLQAVFVPRSSFWSEHGYRCGKSGFFSNSESLNDFVCNNRRKQDDPLHDKDNFSRC